MHRAGKFGARDGRHDRCSFERHATFRTISGAGLMHLEVHRANVVGRRNLSLLNLHERQLHSRGASAKGSATTQFLETVWCCCSLELTGYPPVRNVSLNLSRRRAVGMCEITALGDFQGLWEGWDGFIVPPFPSDHHFHRHRLRRFWLEVWSIDSSRVLLVSGLLAVGPYLGLVLRVLLRLDERECMP